MNVDDLNGHGCCSYVSVDVNMGVYSVDVLHIRVMGMELVGERCEVVETAGRGSVAVLESASVAQQLQDQWWWRAAQHLWLWCCRLSLLQRLVGLTAEEVVGPRRKDGLVAGHEKVQWEEERTLEYDRRRDKLGIRKRTEK